MPDAGESLGLSLAIVAALQSVLARFARIERAVVYGSRAKGNHRNGSDIDLALFGAALTQGDLLAIEVAIDDLDLPHTVDLSLFAAIEDPAVRSHIERVGKQLYPGATATEARR